MERSRRGKSHSSNFSSHKFQSNPTKSVRPSNSDHHYKNKTTHQQKHRQEEDDYDSFNSLPSLVGTCPHMCPEEERAQRERLRDLAVFERLNGNLGKTSSSLAVKKFCRTISTKHLQASDVRPLPVLEDTLNYLLNLVDSSEFPFEVVHEFVFDRTRSIRQDLSMQNIIDDQAIHMYEKMVKFHVISHHKLRRCSGSSNISPMHHLNMEQLTKALTSLYDLYEANWSSHSIYKNEAEFRSLYVLLHLGSDSQPMGESLSLWFRRVPSRIIKSKEMSFARRLLRYFRLGNYKRFICTTVAEASCLQYCIIEHYINEVRGFAVSFVNHGGYKLHPYPLSDLSKLLMIKESDVESFCNDCGLEISTDELGNKFLPAKQTTFCRPKGGFQNYCLLSSEQFERLFAEGSEFQ
ncbi:SAC3 family protein C [Cornus florida]|uniref:SAC3 family protein C n=1 Tax=Cornus florida TaxID=4283 RepID=UPI0028A065B0|nr:SAC3 family protein C [Cornus florida]